MIADGDLCCTTPAHSCWDFCGSPCDNELICTCVPSRNERLTHNAPVAMIQFRPWPIPVGNACIAGRLSRNVGTFSFGSSFKSNCSLM